MRSGYVWRTPGDMGASRAEVDLSRLWARNPRRMTSREQDVRCPGNAPAMLLAAALGLGPGVEHHIARTDHPVTLGNILALSDRIGARGGSVSAQVLRRSLIAAMGAPGHAMRSPIASVAGLDLSRVDARNLANFVEGLAPFASSDALRALLQHARHELGSRRQ